MIADHEDVAYLLSFANRYFPGAALAPHDVVSAWAGVRPLLANAEGHPSAASREHRLVTHEPGFVSLFGGKLTTYRTMAREALDRLVGKGRCVTGSRPLPGGRGFPQGDDARRAFEADLADRFRLDADVAGHLASTYGSRAALVADLAARTDGGRERVVADLPVLVGELAFSVEREGTVHPEDFLRRRTDLLYKVTNPGEAASRVVERMKGVAAGPAEIRGWEKDLELRSGPGAQLWL